MTPSRLRELVTFLRTAYGVSERRACGTVGPSRATQRYRSVADPQDELRLRLHELAAMRVRYGYRRLSLLLRREGYAVNHKRIYRLYREEAPAIRPKVPRRRRACRYREVRPETSGANEVWAGLHVGRAVNGRCFRLLTVVDCHTREALAVVPRTSFRAFDVVDVLDGLVRGRGAPRSIRSTTAQSSPGGCSVQLANQLSPGR